MDYEILVYGIVVVTMNITALIFFEIRKIQIDSRVEKSNYFKFLLPWCNKNIGISTLIEVYRVVSTYCIINFFLSRIFYLNTYFELMIIFYLTLVIWNWLVITRLLYKSV